MNVKSIQYVNKESDIAEYNIKPNFSSINQKYKDNKSIILDEIKTIDSMTIYKSLKEKKLFKLQTIDIELDDNDFIVDEIPFENYFLTSNNNIIVSIKTELNNDLIEEGITRDFVRKIQNLRKDSGYQVDDRINISILADKTVYSAIDNNKEYLLNEVLGTELKYEKNLYNDTVKFKIKNTDVLLSISKYT